MACENCSDEMRSAVRSQNRALRLVNRNLRKKTNELQEHSDEVFLALCETNPISELVLREICEKAGIVFSTDDYETMADSVVNALTSSSNPTFQ